MALKNPENRINWTGNRFSWAKPTGKPIQNWSINKTKTLSFNLCGVNGQPICIELLMSVGSCHDTVIAKLCNISYDPTTTEGQGEKMKNKKEAFKLQL